MDFKTFKNNFSKIKDELIEQNDANLFDIAQIIAIIKGIDYSEAMEIEDRKYEKYNNIVLDFIDIFNGCKRKIKYLKLGNKKIKIPNIEKTKLKNFIQFQDIVKRSSNEHLTSEILDGLFEKEPEKLSEEILEKINKYNKQILFDIIINADELVKSFLELEIKEIGQIYFYDVIYTAFFLGKKYLNLSFLLTKDFQGLELRTSYLIQILNEKKFKELQIPRTRRKFYLYTMNLTFSNWNFAKKIMQKLLNPWKIYISTTLQKL